MSFRQYLPWLLSIAIAITFYAASRERHRDSGLKTGEQDAEQGSISETTQCARIYWQRSDQPGGENLVR